jgi:predicted dehydrogenase
MFNVAIIGLGYWGKILLKVFSNNTDINIYAVCDRNEKNLAYVEEFYSDIALYDNTGDIFLDQNIDIMVIATQAKSHFELTLKALNYGKHVFVEKPFALNSQDAYEIVCLNRTSKKVVMVDHTFIFTPEYEVVRDIVNNKLGKILNFYSFRGGFGEFQIDIDVIWNLMYHDLYILDNLFPKFDINNAVVDGCSHVVNGVNDISIASFSFDDISTQLISNIYHPFKDRNIVISGDKKFLSWNSVDTGSVQIWEKSVSYTPGMKRPSYFLNETPRQIFTSDETALEREVNYFIYCIKNNKRPINDEISGHRIVSYIEKIEKFSNFHE